MLPVPYDPGDRKEEGRVFVGGGGNVADGGGAGFGDPIVTPALARTFDVSIPDSISNGNPFNVTVTAKKPDGTTDTAFTGKVSVVLSSWGTSGIDKTFAQNTAPAAVSWTNGVCTISCTITANSRQLAAAAGTFMKVKAIYGGNAHGPISGESNRGWVTATGFFTVGLSETSVNVDATFLLTLTAKTAAGVTDTAYAAIVNVTDDNTDLEIQDAAGTTFSQFAAGDFTNGVATKTIRLHAAALSAAASVAIDCTENGVAAPSGQQKITVGELPAKYGLTLADAYNQVRDASPNTVFANNGRLLYNNVAGVEENYEVLIHLATPIPAGNVLWALLNEKEGLAIYTPSGFPKTISAGSGYLLEVYPVTADWDPTTVTWNTKPTTGSVRKKDILELTFDIVGLDSGTFWPGHGIAGVGDMEWPSFRWLSLATVTYGFLLKLVARGGFRSVGGDGFYVIDQILVSTTGADANRSRVLSL